MKQFNVTWESGWVSDEILTRQESGELFLDSDNGEMNDPSPITQSEMELMDLMAVGEILYFGECKNIKVERIS